LSTGSASARMYAVTDSRQADAVTGLFPASWG